MSSRILVAVVVACASAACGAPSSSGPSVVFDACEPIVVVPAPGTTGVERAAIADGVALWTRLGVAAFTLDDVPGARRIPVEFQEAAAAFHGFYDADVGAVFVNRGLADAHERAVTVAHELGHAVGLMHVDDRVSVMERANLDTEPNAGDLAAVRALWGACSSPTSGR